MTSYKRFQQGSGAYNCRICGKLTRATGYDEESVELCARCLLQEYVYNAEADYGKDSDNHKRALRDLETYDKEHPQKKN